MIEPNSTTNQINEFLERAKQLFVQNNVVDSLALAQEAAQLAIANRDISSAIEANVFLSKLSFQNVRYLGLDAGTACDYIKNAKALLDKASNEDTISTLLQTAQIYIYNNEFTSAAGFLNDALERSRKQDDPTSTILSLCGLSQLATKQNKSKEALIRIQDAMDLLVNSTAEISAQVQTEVYHELSQVYLRRQEYTKLHDSCQKTLELCRLTGDVEKEMIATNSLGIYYATKLDQKTAMQHFLDALDISKKIGYRAMTAQYLINIATVYAQLYNFDDAADRYTTLLEEYDDILDNNTRVIVYNNLGTIQLNLERPEVAQPHLQRALDLARTIQYKEMIAHSLAQLCRTNILLQNHSLAIQQMEEASELVEALGDINGKQINLINKGSIFLFQKEYSKAIKLLSKGITAAKRMKDDASERRGYQLLSKLYKKQKDYEQALKFQTVYSEAREHFYKEMRNRQSIDLEIKYAIKEKQQEIERLRTENSYKDLLLEQKDQLAKQNAKLIEVNEELRQFAYAVSHDLKEPLRMIGSYTQLIHKRHHESFDKNSTAYFEFVNEGVKRMNNLLDGLLKYATVGKTEADMEEVNLSTVLELSVINLRVTMEETKAIVDAERLPKILSVKSLWIQLFQNLISNAIKFRKPQTIPQITIRHQIIEDEVIVSISDNGIGIKPEYKERIFIIFQRLHSRDAFDGTGIGLAICHKIMKRLNGRIWVESEEGEGATFYCAVPID
ncbi:MAG: tetratricopeptide repeat protein [Saprospiraceae bacterium]